MIDTYFIQGLTSPLICLIRLLQVFSGHILIYNLEICIWTSPLILIPMTIPNNIRHRTNSLESTPCILFEGKPLKVTLQRPKFLNETAPTINFHLDLPCSLRATWNSFIKIQSYNAISLLRRPVLHFVRKLNLSDMICSWTAYIRCYSSPHSFF